jgi:hypothetical protein
VDPTEDTASNSSYIVAMGDCLAMAPVLLMYLLAVAAVATASHFQLMHVSSRSALQAISLPGYGNHQLRGVRGQSLLLAN